MTVEWEDVGKGEVKGEGGGWKGDDEGKGEKGEVGTSI